MANIGLSVAVLGAMGWPHLATERPGVPDGEVMELAGRLAQAGVVGAQAGPVLGDGLQTARVASYFPRPRPLQGKTSKAWLLLS